MKRKRETQKFYAVRAGKRPGIYMTWKECEAQINGFAGAVYKSFPTRQEADSFVKGQKSATSTEPDRYYAVAVGTRTGIFTDWTEAQDAYTGTKEPKYKKFNSRAEALAWMRTISPAAANAAEKDKKAEPSAKKTKTAAAPEPSAQKTSKSAGSEIVDSSRFLVIYTDGSSLSNGKAGAVAGVGVYFGKGDERNISERLQGELQTNQRAELTAILRALHVAAVDQPVQIFSDSKYSISCVTEWYIGWQRKNWHTKSGEVKNKDLIQDILKRIDERNLAIGHAKTKFTWVKGHGTDVGNIAADQLAVAGARGSA